MKYNNNFYKFSVQCQVLKTLKMTAFTNNNKYWQPIQNLTETNTCELQWNKKTST